MYCPGPGESKIPAPLGMEDAIFRLPADVDELSPPCGGLPALKSNQLTSSQARFLQVRLRFPGGRRNR